MDAMQNFIDFVSLAKFNLSKFWRFAKKEIWPIKGKKYFIDNIVISEKIGEDKRNGHFLYTLYALLVFSFLMSVAQSFCDHPIFILLTFDYIGLNQLSANVKMSKALMNIATFYFYKYSYFIMGSFKSFLLIRKFLVDNDKSPALGSTFNFWKLITWSLAFYQVLVASFELCLIGAYLQFCVALSAQSFGSIHLWLLAYLSMSLSFVLFSSTCFLICVGGFTGSIGLSVIFLLFERIKIATRRFLNHSINILTPARLLRYQRENVQTMRFEFDIAPIYGTLLTIFLATNMPSNVTFIAILVLGTSYSLSVNFFFIIVIFGQITVLIFFHLVAAMVTNRLHRPYKVINSQFVRYKNLSLISHIRIANNIQTFMVKKRYGINYKMLGMTFGLVSMAAFVKFILLYSEMILYSYSMYLKAHSRIMSTE